LLARDLPQVAHHPSVQRRGAKSTLAPAPTLTTIYRVLGGDAGSTIATMQAMHAPHPQWVLAAIPEGSPRAARSVPSPPGYAQGRDLYGHLLTGDGLLRRASVPPAANVVWRGLLAVGLCATVAALAWMLLVVTPALARGSEGLVLSGYTELSAGPQPVKAQQTVPANPEPQPEAQPPPAPPAPPAQHAPTGQPYEVVGPPSIGVAQIEAVLQKYGSPAAGLGQRLYDLGVTYGIDPAFALAFFVHESACGTRGVARFTRSLGNIRWTEGYENYEGYRLYPSWEAGFEDWYKLITELYIGQWNLRTVDQIVPVYAPWGDNNHPPSYIASIKSMVDLWREQASR
jgi:hypothetical protein